LGRVTSSLGGSSSSFETAQATVGGFRRAAVIWLRTALEENAVVQHGVGERAATTTAGPSSRNILGDMDVVQVTGGGLIAWQGEPTKKGARE
jgi:hypothetical protein